MVAMDSKPKLLDLYCGGGGASYGYELAGWDVTGVDNIPQPKYRGKFVQADALDYLMAHYHEFDAIHASPPCQKYTKAGVQFRAYGKEYPDLIGPTRDLLKTTGLPYVIENVPDAPLHNPILLCGTMFGIRTYRHRLFESNIELKQPEHPEHVAPNAKMGRRVREGEYIQYVGHFTGLKMVQDMTGLHWLGVRELAQSIPPQYAEFLGGQLLESL
jgi:DNA (cytosine-5)-methyltransferase 1